MTTRPFILTLVCATAMALSSTANAQLNQYPSWNGYSSPIQAGTCANGQCGPAAGQCQNGQCPTSPCANGRCSLPGAAGMTQPAVPAGTAWNGYDWNQVGNVPRYQPSVGSVKPDRYRSGAASGTNGAFHPASASDTSEFPGLPSSLADLRRTPNAGVDWRIPSDLNNNQQTRYRIPLDRMSDPLSDPALNDGFSARPSGSGPFNPRIGGGSMDGRRGSRRGGYDSRGSDNNRPGDLRSNSGYDQYQYEPLPGALPGSQFPTDNWSNGNDPFMTPGTPQTQLDDEAKAIYDLITRRYENPANVRAIRAMSANQAAQLFNEVSQKIDERHLEPVSYDLRVQRALRNLTMALDNPAFLQGLGMSESSFQTDGFRNTLARLSGSSTVRSRSEAASVMNAVMQASQSVPGLTPNVIAFEFANASVDALDRFSALEPADPRAFSGADLPANTKSAALEENIVGVGLELKQHDRGLLVVKPLRGGPAEEAGIEPGDIVVAIDGRNIAGMGISNSVDLMKGSEGSRLVLRISRSGRGERDFSLLRRTVRVWTVDGAKIINGTNLAYLSLDRFAQNSTAELDQALSELYKQGMKSLVVDLRGNPGGLLTTCVEITDRFVPCGTIVSTKGRLSSDNMVEAATFTKTWSTPMVVLIDGDSASASEIFAAAIQENQRGVIVGTRSYGKGTVQTHFPLSTVSGNLRLTTARFYSPNGRPMAGEGVTPDVLVNDADGVENGDEALQRAIQIAQSPQLAEMAKASGTCRTKTNSAARSSSLDNLKDGISTNTVIR
ncbi:MAG: S41 family peptidase [Planctomycetaceae bacterium]|nr:S41 family peptidase [Planctomycetaceae bacterium]